MKVKYLFLLPLTIYCNAIFSQDSLLQNIEISLITCDPGDELYSIYGHSAIKLFDYETGVDEVYNYGVFNQFESNFLLKFLRGKLLYRVGVARYDNFLEDYYHFRRGVKEEIITLPVEDKVKFIKFLRYNALPENASYLYDFFYDNCATRISEGLENVIDKQILYPKDDGLTYRQMIHQHLHNWPWTKFGIDLIIASRSDIKTGLKGQMFLPNHLSKLLSQSKIEGSNEALLGPPKMILDYPNRNDQSKSFNWPMLVFTLIGLLLWGLWFFNKHDFLNKIITLLVAVLAIASLLVAFMWFGTDHGATKINYNLVWLSPLYIGLLFVKGGQKKWVIYLLLVSTFICLLPILPQVMPVYTMGFLLFSVLIINLMLTQKKLQIAT